MQNDPREPDEMDEKRDSVAKDNWADDQKQRGYYYDDAHGYEEFDPERADAEEGDQDESGGEESG
jgi:hypothetical protein